LGLRLRRHRILGGIGIHFGIWKSIAPSGVVLTIWISKGD